MKNNKGKLYLQLIRSNEGGVAMDKKIKKYFENPHMIKCVKAEENYVLLLTFDNGEIKQYNMANDLTGVFTVLKNKDKFNQAFINNVGNVAWNIDDNVDSSVVWTNQIDLCKDALYMDSVPIKT